MLDFATKKKKEEEGFCCLKKVEDVGM
jgi:hypothetical protein